MNEAVELTGPLTGFSKTDGGVGAKTHFTLFAKPLIAEAPFTPLRAGSGEIEVVAVADGFAEKNGFQPGII